jgi:hypothetical protein
MNSFNEIKNLWLEFYKLPFPSMLGGTDVARICVTSLDTFAAGCIDTFVNNKGLLDDERINILDKCRSELEIIVENLDAEAKTYFEKLLEITNKILKIAKRQKS